MPREMRAGRGHVFCHEVAITVEDHVGVALRCMALRLLCNAAGPLVYILGPCTYFIPVSARFPKP